MTQRLIDKRSATGYDLTPGAVLVTTVTLHIDALGGIRTYDCGYPCQTAEGIPQGGRINLSPETIKELFPVVGWAELV